MDEQLQQVGFTGDEDRMGHGQGETEVAPEEFLVWSSMDLPGMDREDEHD